MLRLKLCGINICRLFCVNWIIVKFVCFEIDIFLNSVVVYIGIFMYFFYGFFIIWIYMYFIRICVRFKDDRVKFM